MIRSVDLDGQEKYVVIGKTNPDGSVSSAKIELQTAGKLGEGVLTVFVRSNGIINLQYTAATGAVADRERGFFSNVSHKIGNFFKGLFGGGGGDAYYAENGQSKEIRKGDGTNTQTNIDLLLSTVSASKSAAEGADMLFKAPKTAKEFFEKVGNVIDAYENAESTIDESKKEVQLIIRSVEPKIQIDGAHTSGSRIDTVNPGDPLPKGSSQPDTMRIIDKDKK